MLGAALNTEFQKKMELSSLLAWDNQKKKNLIELKDSRIGNHLPLEYLLQNLRSAHSFCILTTAAILQLP